MTLIFALTAAFAGFILGSAMERGRRVRRNQDAYSQYLHDLSMAHAYRDAGIERVTHEPAFVRHRRAGRSL